MSNESFEGFYKKQISCEQYALSYNSRDMEIIRNHYERSKANMKETWIHQQKKIQELDKLLGEAVKMLNESNQLDSYLFGDGDYDIEIFLSKPEIQKYLPEGEV